MSGPAPLRATAALFVASGAAFGAWLPFLPIVAGRLSLSDATLGLVMGSVALAAAATMPLAGALVERRGCRPPVAIGGALLVVGLSLPMHVPTLAALLVVTTAIGVAYGLVDIAMNAHAVAVERHGGRPVMSTLHGCFSLGTFAGASLSAATLWAGIPPAAGMTMAALAIGALIAVAQPHLTLTSHAETAPGRPTAAIVGLGLVAACAMALESGFENWTAVWLTGDGWPAASAASAIGVYAAGATLARFGGDRAARRVGRPALFRASGIVATAGLSLALAADTPAVTYAGLFVGGLGTGNLVPILFAIAGAQPGVPPAMGVAWAATLGYIGLLAAPPLVGAAAGWTGLTPALRALAWLGVVAAVASVALTRGARTTRAPGAPPITSLEEELS